MIRYNLQSPIGITDYNETIHFTRRRRRRIITNRFQLEVPLEVELEKEGRKMLFKPGTKVALTVLIAVLYNMQQTITATRSLPQESNSSGTNSTNIERAPNSNRIANKTSIESSPQGHTTTGAPSGDALETAPSITSVHQVWTSSSSGSVDELSPEVISKLRNDVPFLAAYALRPRLVGAAVPLIGDGQVSGMTMPSLDTSSSDRSRVVVVDGGASPVVKTSARQQVASADSLVPKLGDFSEFNVETSSTSKSEHHHKRKTSLKRPPSGTNRAAIVPESGQSSTLLSRRSPTKASGKRKRSQLTNSSKSGAKLARNGSKSAQPGQASKKTKRGSKGRGRSGKQPSSGRLVSNGKLQQAATRMSTIKRGRYFQEQSIGSNGGKTNEIDLDMRALGRDTTTLMTMLSDGASKGSDAGVKGGQVSGTKRPPFYAAAEGRKQPTKSPETTTTTTTVGSGRDKDDDDGSNNENEAPVASGRGRGDKTADRAGEQGNGIDGSEPEAGTGSGIGGGAESSRSGPDKDRDEAVDDEPIVDEPKRVGDDDVDEDGDTVLIEPKSDGVDDDPPLPIEGDEADGNDAAIGEGGDNAVDSGERGSGRRDDDKNDDSQPTGADGSGARSVPTGDPRGNRPARERPNSLSPGTGSDSSDGADGPGGQAISGGGGIGAVIGDGNGGSGGSGAKDGRNSDDDDDHRDSRAPSKGAKPATGSGVEFADENKNTDDNETDEGGSRTNEPRAKDGDRESDDGREMTGEKNGGAKGSAPGSNDEGRPFGDRRKEAGGGQPSGRGDGDKDQVDSDEDDLDYRDEMDERGRGSKGGQQGSGLGREDKDHQGGRTDEETDENSGERRKATGKSDGKSIGVGSSKKEHCDDGTYNHHDEHHHHHDTIDWLRGSISGEPDDDYPILSRVNTTNFKCSDQKHPGYYADVESRCQVSSLSQQLKDTLQALINNSNH